ncbi:hypothetical protein Tco_0899709 [Tanacetum coccineum]
MSNTRTNPSAELKVVTSTDGLTLDGSFLPHSNFLVYQEKEQEPETITEVVEIASSKSTPLVLPPETLPLSALKPKEDPKPILISHRFHIHETDSFLSLDDSIPPGIDNGIYDSEGDILFLEELLNNEILSDLPPKELKDDEPSTTKSLIKKPLEIDNEIYDSEGDIFFLENLLKDGPSKADKLEIYTLKGELPDTFLMEDDEIKLNPLKDSDDSVPIPRVSVTPLDSLDSFFDSYDTSYTNPSELDYEYTLNYDNLIFNIQNEHCDEREIETIMDEVHSTVQIPPLFEELTSDKSMQDIILHRIRHGMVNSLRLSFYLDFFSPEDNFGSLSFDSFELGDQNVVFDPGIFFLNGVFSFMRESPHLLINNFLIDKCHILREISLMIKSSVCFHPKDKEIRGESS